MDGIYIGLAELDMITEALETRRNQCVAQKAAGYRQLIFKLNKLQPKFGLQIISDPSERETAS